MADTLPHAHTLTIDEPKLGTLDAARERLIVALDSSSAQTALELTERLAGQCRWFKVGLELYVAAGPAIVETLVGRGYSIFLDLKLHDIPNTVAGAVRSAAALGAKLLTVHAGGGPVMLTAAREAAEGCATAPKLLAVTVLTSMDAAQLAATGVARVPREQVELLARMGMTAGIDGFVCSPQEVALLREITGPAGTLVTPGIRPAGAEIGDQQRVATPAAALKAGSSYLVVGRPITQAGDPGEAAEGILREMAGVKA
jgi:orotidine-5'-phosphate decarboxylase